MIKNFQQTPKACYQLERAVIAPRSSVCKVGDHADSANLEFGGGTSSLLHEETEVFFIV